MNTKQCLAIIPARGGSKRIPRKNIKMFCGYPIIKYSIQAAFQSKLFDEVMVSTDDNEIAKIALTYDVKVPFLRSAETSNDSSTTDQVINEVLSEYKKKGTEFNYFCCIYPTAPFIKSSVLIESYNILNASKIDAVIPVVKFSYPIQRAFRIKEKYLEMYWSENYNKRSQDLETSYHDAGQFYWMKTNSFLKHNRIFVKKTAAYEISEFEAQDIDTVEDWKIAEIKYKLFKYICK